MKVGYNVRHFAAVTGDGHLQWYFERICELAKGTEGAFYNHGWWSFAFDDLQYRHDWPQVPAVEPRDLPLLKHFHDVGWVAVQRDLHDPDEHLQFTTKCSRFGSISHSHGDQGAFLLFAHGEELAIQSGYYVGFGTRMHRQWRRLTKSKNAILIDGKGQYAGTDKALQIRSAGRVLAATEDAESTVFISLDPTEAYRQEVPYLRRYRRDFHLIRGRHLLVVDELELEQEGQVQWLMQLMARPQLGQNSFRHEGERGGVTGEFVFCSSGPVSLSTAEGFDDVDLAEIKGLPLHHRVIGSTPRARAHTLVTLLTPYRKGRIERLHHFIDDQGHGVDLYFQDALDRSYSVRLPKRF
jgi:Heparinase II/III-like protein